MEPVKHTPAQAFKIERLIIRHPFDLPIRVAEKRRDFEAERDSATHAWEELSRAMLAAGIEIKDADGMAFATISGRRCYPKWSQSDNTLGDDHDEDVLYRFDIRKFNDVSGRRNIS